MSDKENMHLFPGLESLGDDVGAAVVDGVRVVYANRPGPLAARLAFRVGVADEPLPLRGSTHLVEHLALHRFGSLARHQNGHVQSFTTEFDVVGSEAQVVDFLNGVCAALRDLPLHRLELEKTVLRTESQSRGSSTQDALLRARFGARGLARLSFAENALEWVGADEVSDWARRWFVTNNAVLWLSANQIPPGLDLRLPAGPHSPRALVEGIKRPRPTSLPGPPRIVMVDALHERSTAATLAVELMRVALFRELRLETALSYTAHAEYAALDAHTARILVYADSTDQNEDAVVGGMVDSLAALREGRIEQRDLDTARRAFVDAVEHRIDPGSLGLYAFERLLHREDIRSLRDLAAEVEAVTLADLVSVFEAFWRDGMWLTPGESADWFGASVIDYSSPHVEGRWYDYVGSREFLVLGDEGVSWVAPGQTLTVRADACDLFLSTDDGARLMIGHDAVSITVEPTLIRGFGGEQLAQLDAIFAREQRVSIEARPSGRIPEPIVVDRPPRKREYALWAGFAGLVAAIPVVLVVSLFFLAALVLAGLLVGWAFAVLRSIDYRRNLWNIECVLADRGVEPGSHTDMVAFTVAPTERLAESVDALRTVFERGSTEVQIQQPTRPIVVADRHVLMVCEESQGRLLAIPTASITSISVGMIRLKTPRRAARAVRGVLVDVAHGGATHRLQLALSGDFMHRVSDAEADRMAALLRDCCAIADVRAD